MRFGYLDAGCRDLDSFTWGGVVTNNHKPLPDIEEVDYQTAKCDKKHHSFCIKSVRRIDRANKTTAKED